MKIRDNIKGWLGTTLGAFRVPGIDSEDWEDCLHPNSNSSQCAWLPDLIQYLVVKVRPTYPSINVCAMPVAYHYMRMYFPMHLCILV